MIQTLNKVIETDYNYLTYFIDERLADRSGKSSNWSLDDDHVNYIQEGNLYRPSDITYTFNRDGFRCDSIDNNNAEIVFIGCSFTEGVGLPLKDLWCTHVHQALYPNTSYINLGLSGMGVEGCAEILKYFWDRTKQSVKDIVFWVPNYHRRLYRVNNRITKTWVPASHSFKKPYSLELFADEEYAEHKCMMAFNKIILVAELMQANLHIYDSNKNSIIKKWYPNINHIDFYKRDASNDIDDRARDLSHMGPSDSKRHAEYIIKNIKEFYER